MVKISKVLFFILSFFYVVYIFGVVFTVDWLVMEMSNPILELYGFISGMLVLASLFSHGFSKDIFKCKTVNIILVNTMICALISYVSMLFNEFHLLSVMEVFTLTSLYLIIYLPIFFIMRELASKANVTSKT